MSDKKIKHGKIETKYRKIVQKFLNDNPDVTKNHIARSINSRQQTVKLWLDKETNISLRILDPLIKWIEEYEQRKHK